MGFLEEVNALRQSSYDGARHKVGTQEMPATIVL